MHTKAGRAACLSYAVGIPGLHPQVQSSATDLPTWQPKLFCHLQHAVPQAGGGVRDSGGECGVPYTYRCGFLATRLVKVCVGVVLPVP
jgi:hypothetical protein